VSLSDDPERLLEGFHSVRIAAARLPIIIEEIGDVPAIVEIAALQHELLDLAEINIQLDIVSFSFQNVIVAACR
jgi:hypothetical protein